MFDPPPTLGSPNPLPSPPPPPPGRRTADGRRYLPALAVAIVGVLAVAAVSVTTGVFDDDGIAHPDAWDPRVADLAAFVEAARGLEFDHPVSVEFLSPDEYSEVATRDEGALDAEGREGLDRLAGHLRALGLASGELDLFDDINTVTDSGTLAFYRPDDATVRVRGTELTVTVRVTLVHELTHALQDQHFDLGEIMGGDMEDGEASARRTLIEGDALRIEDQFVDEGLTDDERTTYDRESASESDDGLAAVSEVPSFVTASFGVPYALGRPFVTMVGSDGGNDAIDAAFRKPPSTEEHLFDPVTYLDDEEAIEVGTGLDEDIDTTDDGTFAPFEWYLVLGERIDPKQALEAALGWGGSNYVAYERDDRACIRMVFAGDTDDDDEEMQAALERWQSVLPDGLVDVVELIEVEGHPGIDACDPGTGVDVAGADRSLDLLVLPAVHAYLQADAVSVLDTTGARCYAREVIDRYRSEALLAPEGAVFLDPGFEDAARAAYDACR